MFSWFQSKASKKSTNEPLKWCNRILDEFESLEQIQKALQQDGLESCELIYGIDYTASNVSSGERSFGGKSLHTISDAVQNPYQEVMTVISRTLQSFDDDNFIPLYGFGDKRTSTSSVFSLMPQAQPCYGLDGALMAYSAVTPAVQLSGPTTFAPLILQAIKTVSDSGNRYHILIIIADGQVQEVQETQSAIVEASQFPLSIIMVGVGDGPFDEMERFDDELPQRQFDNFQFVNFTKLKQQLEGHNKDFFEAQFAVNALMEIPQQYRLIQKLRLLHSSKRMATKIPSVLGPPGT